MGWSEAFGLHALPEYGAGVLMFALALWLLYLKPRSVVHRAFAAFLLFRATILSVGTFRDLVEDAQVVRALTEINPVFVLPLVPIVAYFGSVYPRRRGVLGTRRWGAVALLLLVVLVDGLYALDPTVYRTFEVTPEGRVVTTDTGPLFAFVGLNYVSYGVLGWLFARDYAAAPAGPARRSLYLMSLGFMLNAVHDGTGGLLGTLSFDAAGFWGGFTDAALTLTLVPVMAGGIVLARHRVATRDRDSRDAVRRFLLLLLLPFASVVAVASLGWAGAEGASENFTLFTSGVWRLTIPLLATYAIVRHQLFDIDVKVRWTIKQSTIAAIFLAVFFVVSEGAQALFSNRMGTFLGIGAAALLILALAPLQRLAERVATTAMPDARPLDALGGSERAALYRDQARLAWSDGTLDRNERALLDQLRERLGLTRDEAARLEEDATRS